MKRINYDILDDLDSIKSSQDIFTTSALDADRIEFDDPEKYEFMLRLNVIYDNPTDKIEELYDRVSYITDNWKFDNSGLVAVSDSQEADERFSFPVYLDPEVTSPFFKGRSATLQFRVMFNVPDFQSLSSQARQKNLYRLVKFLADVQVPESKIFNNRYYLTDIYRSVDGEFRYIRRCDWIQLCELFIYYLNELIDGRLNTHDREVKTEIQNGISTVFLPYFQILQLKGDLTKIYKLRNTQIFKNKN